jgi:hypothetical protein
MYKLIPQSVKIHGASVIQAPKFLDIDSCFELRFPIALHKQNEPSLSAGQDLSFRTALQFLGLWRVADHARN